MCVLALAAFVVGTVAMKNVTVAPAGADLSGYNYLQGGLAHFDWGIVGIVQTAFMGLALAISYLVTKRNLWALVLAHACIDTLLLVQMYSGVAPP